MICKRISMKINYLQGLQSSLICMKLYKENYCNSPKTQILTIYIYICVYVTMIELLKLLEHTQYHPNIIIVVI